MKFKKTGAEKTTITRDLNKFIEKTLLIEWVLITVA